MGMCVSLPLIQKRGTLLHMFRFYTLHNVLPILHGKTRNGHSVRHVSSTVRQRHIQHIVINQQSVGNHRLPRDDVDLRQRFEVVSRVRTNEVLEGLLRQDGVVVLLRVHALPNAGQMVILSAALRVTRGEGGLREPLEDSPSKLR